MNTVIQDIPAKRLEWKEVDGFHTWEEARRLEGDGWGLPLTRELVELSKSKLIPSETYCWSASRCHTPDGSWVVYLPSGRVDIAMRRDTYPVLLVRDCPENLTGEQMNEVNETSPASETSDVERVVRCERHRPCSGRYSFDDSVDTCGETYNCCDCGGNGCGCGYCFSCNACDTCKGAE